MTDAGWADVLRRATRVRRRRRVRTAVVALAVAVVALVGALAASGQIGSLLSHSKEPHLILRAQLRTPAGAALGNLELELHRAAVVFGPDGPEVRRFAPPGALPGPYPVRWFLQLGADAGGVLSVAGHVLCDRCRAGDSGRVELTQREAGRLVSGDAHAVYTRHGDVAASAPVVLSRTALQRGLICTRARGLTRCGRIFTGR
jgi:hypothetical protein